MRGLERFAPLTGVAFVAVVAAGFIVVGDNAPDSDESLAKVVAYWRNNDSDEITGAILTAYASVLFLWFAGVVRSVLRLAEGGSGRLAATAFAGAVVAAGGFLANGTIEFAVAASADDLTPQATQALSALYAGFFFPFLAGVGVFFLATGLALVRTGAMSPWLGWTAVLLGVVGLTPVGFISLLAGLVWIFVVSVMLFMAQPATGPAPPAASPPPAQP